MGWRRTAARVVGFLGLVGGVVTIVDAGGRWGWWAFAWRYWRWAWTVLLLLLAGALLVATAFDILQPDHSRLRMVAVIAGSS